MGKLLFMVIMFSLNVTGMCSAQEYKKLKVGLGLGVTLNPGLLIALEPAYRINDDFVLGLRIEGAMVLVDNGSIKYFSSFTLNGQYYLSDKSYRWFMGTGLGVYRVSGDYIDGVVSEFGFYPRVGFDLGHRSLAIDFNFISPSQGAQTIKTNYLGLRFGLYFGGGRKFPSPNG